MCSSQQLWHAKVHSRTELTLAKLFLIYTNIRGWNICREKFAEWPIYCAVGSLTYLRLHEVTEIEYFTWATREYRYTVWNYGMVLVCVSDNSDSFGTMCVCVASASLAQLAKWETAHRLLSPSRDVLWCISLCFFPSGTCSCLLKMLLCKAGLFHFRCSLPPT